MSEHAFAVTDAGAFKRVHLSTCRYARRPYLWADQFGGDENLLLVELMWTGAVGHHVGCRVCCPQLDVAMEQARAAHVRNVILDHLGVAAGDCVEVDE